jgi:hypothetical protein
VVDEVVDDEGVDGVCGFAVEAGEVGAGAVFCEFVEDLVHVFFVGDVHLLHSHSVTQLVPLFSWWMYPVWSQLLQPRRLGWS